MHCLFIDIKCLFICSVLPNSLFTLLYSLLMSLGAVDETMLGANGEISADDIWDVFLVLFFFGGRNLSFHADCLLRGQYEMSGPFFLGGIASIFHLLHLPIAC